MTRPILVLAGESPLPANSGVRRRTLQLSRELADVFAVEVAALGEVPSAGDEPFALRGIPHRRTRARALAASVLTPYQAALVRSSRARRHVLSRRWATMQSELPFVAPMLLGIDAAPLVLDAHNVESDVLRTMAEQEHRPVHRARWRWEAAKTERFERTIVRAATAVCATSEEDAASLEAMGARRIAVVPNGVACAAVAWRAPADSAELAYVGHLGYKPNADAARELVSEVLPIVHRTRPDASVLIVGREPPHDLAAREEGHVRVTGEVPDVLPFLRRARSLVLPLRSGGGTRLKALEALAAGVPLVSTRFGVAGLDVRDGEHVLLGERPAELAAQALRVLEDDALAERLSTAGRRLVETRYDWSVVARPLIELHAELGAA
ncbi:MAG TPA: glycosyltransferase family 4 protein [Gaiellaceae bacterium]|nr:glycosyltransferase family 4 protein [Gaiellaceae bacterium]